MMLLALAASVVMLFVTSDGEAVLRRCADAFAASASDAEERKARTAALEKLFRGSGAFDRAYAGWMSAWEMQTACSKTSGGMIECTTSGRPCRLEQAPMPVRDPLKRQGERMTPLTFSTRVHV